MKYQISCIGKSENKTEKLLIDKYLKRIGPKLKIKELNLKKFNSLTEIEKQNIFQCLHLIHVFFFQLIHSSIVMS